MQTRKATYHVELVIREKPPRVMGLHGKPIKVGAGGQVWKHIKSTFNDHLAALQQLQEWREEYKAHDELLFTNTWITWTETRDGFTEDWFEF